MNVDVHDKSDEASQSSNSIYLDGSYLEKNKNWHSEDSPWKALQISRLLQSNNIRPETICEVGCGAGKILDELSHVLPNTKFYGYEISPQAYELCKIYESEKIDFFNEDILSEESFYDCLLCIDVIEHVEDYIGFAKALRKKAKYKIFHIPLDISIRSVLHSSMMGNRKGVGHLHYFVTETALATLEDSGYEILDWFYTKWFEVDPYDRSTTVSEKIMKITRKILYFFSPKLMVRLLGGCSLMVLAK